MVAGGSVAACERCGMAGHLAWGCLHIINEGQKTCYGCKNPVTFFGQKFTLVTDHRPLVWLCQLKDPSVES